MRNPVSAESPTHTLGRRQNLHRGKAPGNVVPCRKCMLPTGWNVCSACRGQTRFHPAIFLLSLSTTFYEKANLGLDEKRPESPVPLWPKAQQPWPYYFHRRRVPLAYKDLPAPVTASMYLQASPMLSPKHCPAPAGFARSESEA